MKKRQTVTVNRRFLEILKMLKPDDRLIAYDTIFNSLFDGELIQIKGSDSLEMALACLGPELRRLQTYFDNGKVAKKFKETTQGLFCPHEASETQANSKQNASELKQEAGPIDIYNINSNNNINNNQSNQDYKIINNKLGCINQSNQAEQASTEATCNEELQALADSLGKIIEPLRAEHVELAIRTMDIIEKTAKAGELTIAGEKKSSQVILAQVVGELRRVPADKLADCLQNLYDDIDTRKVNNKFKYALKSLLNLKTRLPAGQASKSNNKSRGFMEHDYTSAELDAVYDSLDEIDM